MNAMKILWPLSLVALLSLVAVLGAQVPALAPLFLVAVPYAAVALLLGGIVWRVVSWARSPVPFRIPTTCGQQRSLPWIRSARFDNPSTGAGAAVRVFLEVVAFRSLFRNTRADLKPGGRIVYGSDKLLWAGALAFHASLLAILLRHARFLFEPVPAFVSAIQSVDGFLSVGVPGLYASDVVFVAAASYLLGRRLLDPRLRYLSLPADFLPLFLLLGIAASGLLLRHGVRSDLVSLKAFVLSLLEFRPRIPAAVAPLVALHLLLVSSLAALLPFSKLMHLAAPFLSPTRNLPNDSRARRHVNPWNPEVKVHTYAEWEDDFRDKLKAAGLPLEKESP
jgi:nitrate reductase gamma subunit